MNLNDTYLKERTYITPLSEPSWPGDWALAEIPTDLKSSEHGKNFETTHRVLARSPGASRSRFIISSFSLLICKYRGGVMVASRAHNLKVRSSSTPYANFSKDFFYTLSAKLHFFANVYSKQVYLGVFTLLVRSGKKSK